MEPVEMLLRKENQSHFTVVSVQVAKRRSRAIKEMPRNPVRKAENVRPQFRNRKGDSQHCRKFFSPTKFPW